MQDEAIADSTNASDYILWLVCQYAEYVAFAQQELGERLRQRGARIVQCPQAVGFHYHPAFSMEQLPSRLDQEAQVRQ